MGYWNGENAFTETEKTIDVSTGWYSNRGDRDTVALTTGGAGTEVKIDGVNYTILSQGDVLAIVE